MDKEFRKEFLDVPSNAVDQLYKLFKRRPRFVIHYIHNAVVPKVT